MKASRIGVVLVVAWSMSGPKAFAEPDGLSGRAHLDRARTALSELDYIKARDELSAALRTGGLDRAGLVHVYRLTGQVTAAFGDDAKAVDSYLRMLVLDPRAKLPPGLAPKLVSPFDRARKRMRGAAGIAMTVRVDGRRQVEVTVTGDPVAMAKGVVVAFRQPGTERRLRSALRSGRAVVRVPTDVARFFRVRVVDQAGNELLRRESRLPRRLPVQKPAPEPIPEKTRDVIPAPPTASSKTTTSRAPSTPLYARWYVWGVVAVGAGAASVHFGRRALDDWDRLDQVISQSSSHNYQEARDLEASGRRNQLLSNVGLGAAVGLGGVAAYLLVRKSLRGETRRVVPVVGRGRAAVFVQGVFR